MKGENGGMRPLGIWKGQQRGGNQARAEIERDLLNDATCDGNLCENLCGDRRLRKIRQRKVAKDPPTRLAPFGRIGVRPPACEKSAPPGMFQQGRHQIVGGDLWFTHPRSGGRALHRQMLEDR